MAGSTNTGSSLSSSAYIQAFEADFTNSGDEIHFTFVFNCIANENVF
jgi:hypothetical protein